MINAKLVVVGGDAKAAEVNLKLPTIVGRGKEAGLTVPHALVSRRHTEIFEREGKLFVKDLGSLNGTFVNNLRIEDEQPLEPNQLLTLGNITFRAVYELGTMAADANTDTDQNSEIVQPLSKQTATPPVAFDETVPIDSIPRTPQTPDKTTAEPEPDTIEAIEDESSEAGDTDKSFKTTYEPESASNVFSIETEQPSAEKSVSASALEHLPAGSSAVSFVERLETEDPQRDPISNIDPVDVGLDEDQKQPVADDSSLGSFLRKLPR